MTIPVLRPFQDQLVGEVYQAWGHGAQNVVMRLDTGGGKTVCLSAIIRAHEGYSRVIAHRQELIGQLSLTLARNGVRHNVIAAEATVRAIARLHVEELGYSFVDPGSKCAVVSVDTGVRRPDPQAHMVTLWVTDEGHHLVVGNKWHNLVMSYTNPACRGLLPTATPIRADGKGLGREELDGDGIADCMVQGPPMRWLIEQGYLTDYRIVCPPSDLEVLAEVGASGDWSSKQLREAAKRSHIIGDVVKHYLLWARGKLGVTFATDVETATEITAAYRAAGVRAETLTGKTDDFVRRAILRRFAAREIDQIVAVDIISEGFDLPAIEVASMARPTASLSLYMQQFGRTLRPMEGKGKALIIDHAANVIRHNGPPDKPRPWSLARRGARAKGPSDAIPVRVCAGPATPTHPAGGCFEPYERIHKECPHCGYYMEPAGRSSPAMVDGDMTEMSAELLAQLRADVASLDMPLAEKRVQLMDMRVPQVVFSGQLRQHEEKQEAQAELRAAMDTWGGYARARGLSDSAMQREFWHVFGVDVLTAQALAPKAARELCKKVVDRTVNGV